MPDWYHGGEGRRPRRAGARDRERRRGATAARVAYPREVRLLGLNGVAPRFVDALLRRLRGGDRRPAPRLGRGLGGRALGHRRDPLARRAGMNSRVAGDRCALRRVMKAKSRTAAGRTRRRRELRREPARAR